MPLGGADNPFGGLELSAQAALGTPEETPALDEVVAAGDTAQAARQKEEAAHLAAEEPEKTRADILLAVQTEWGCCG